MTQRGGYLNHRRNAGLQLHLGQLCGDHTGTLLLQVSTSIRVAELLDAKQKAPTCVSGSSASRSTWTCDGHEW